MTRPPTPDEMHSFKRRSCREGALHLPRLFNVPAPASFAVSKRYRRQAAVEHGAILYSMQFGAVKDRFIDDADKLVNRRDKSGRPRMRSRAVDTVTVLSNFCHGSFARDLPYGAGVGIDVK